MRSVFFPDTMTVAAAKKFPLFKTFFCQFLFWRSTTYYVPFRAKSRGIYKHFAKFTAVTTNSGTVDRGDEMKHWYRDSLILGFALFSMFFGAGNVIFPPYLGLQCGSRWLLGFACYYLADIGLALPALFAILRRGSPEAVFLRAGPLASRILMAGIVLCIGPLLAIPRTAATTYEMAPFLSPLHPTLFSALFFAVILFLCLKSSAVVDIVGRFLTPALLIGLLILIVKGILTPIGPVSGGIPAADAAVTGIEAGYQTMDVLAAVVFGILILKSIQSRGYTDRDRSRITVTGATVAAAALFIVYLGLAYLGAFAGTVFPPDFSRTQLLLSIVRQLLGPHGITLLAIIVALACVTTAAALASSTAAYFSDLLSISYRTALVLICGFSAVVSAFGLEQIVALASPILSILYPPTLVLILLSFFDRHIPGDRPVRLAALGALLISCLTTAESLGLPLEIQTHFPLGTLGFGWLLPATLCGLLGVWLESRLKNGA